jgi:hypothetical protein
VKNFSYITYLLTIKQLLNFNQKQRRMIKLNMKSVAVMVAMALVMASCGSEASTENTNVTDSTAVQTDSTAVQADSTKADSTHQ